MAGTASEDDPLPVNATALIDVIFCLIIFFMCSFHFKQLDGYMETWMPRGRGIHSGPMTVDAAIDDVRLNLDVDPATGAVVTLFGSRIVESRAHLDDLLAETKAEVAALRRASPRAVIDATPRVPWSGARGHRPREGEEVRGGARRAGCPDPEAALTVR